jgi:hypothetical protein
VLAYKPSCTKSSWNFLFVRVICVYLKYISTILESKFQANSKDFYLYLTSGFAMNTIHLSVSNNITISLSIKLHIGTNPNLTSTQYDPSPNITDNSTSNCHLLSCTCFQVNEHTQEVDMRLSGNNTKRPDETHRAVQSIPRKVDIWLSVR